MPPPPLLVLKIEMKHAEEKLVWLGAGEEEEGGEERGEENAVAEARGEVWRVPHRRRRLEPFLL